MEMNGENGVVFGEYTTKAGFRQECFAVVIDGDEEDYRMTLQGLIYYISTDEDNEYKSRLYSLLTALLPNEERIKRISAIDKANEQYSKSKINIPKPAI